MKKIICTTFIILVFAPAVFSKTADEYQKEITDLEQKVSSLKSQALTLSSQVAYYDSQIALTQLKISQTEDLVGSLSQKIDVLEDQLTQKSKVLVEQIIRTYQSSHVEPLELFLSSRSFSQFMYRSKYLTIIQAANRNYLHDTQLTQSNYESQKNLLITAEDRLRTEKAQLAATRIERDNLLTQTQNNEFIYQKQLEQSKLELEAIQSALAIATKVGPVKAGDPIALTGNSGYPSCSTGKHLHFEVRVNDMWVNAENYLKMLNGVGSGNWEWPLKGDIQVTQRYGKTPWSYRYAYSGGIHTGVDMISSSDIIYAPADGTLYTATEKCGSSQLKLKYIDHGNNLKTLYLHVQ